MSWWTVTVSVVAPKIGARRSTRKNDDLRALDCNEIDRQHAKKYSIHGCCPNNYISTYMSSRHIGEQTDDFVSHSTRLTFTGTFGDRKPHGGQRFAVNCYL